ncbi:uncharacterized protein LOC111626252 isoform X2 [Centruroides sculpturatus]|uniref:uncharacterized protein LOC111626252 isoform X2 n=1 Tax=Centruroides sculpturatus TaxID=218467 RepID=UPI000C6EBE76|nr:uncharacterized protein LOC111626252 isoform X2 [Centruroides sculpturatus]
MMKFLLPFFILSLIPKQPGDCVVKTFVDILKEILDFQSLFPQLNEEVKVALINITAGLPQCLDSSTFPSLGCENEIGGGSNVMSSVTYLSCLLKKVCYQNDTANLVKVVQCLSILTAARVRFILEDTKRNVTAKIYKCLTVIYYDSRVGLTNCDLIDSILAINIQSALENIDTNIIKKLKSDFETLFKILSGDMEADCEFTT